MEFKLNREQLDSMQKYNKIYSYLQQSFTKTYFAMGDGKLTLFFYGQKGAIKTEMNIPEIEGNTRYFQIDFGKWNNGLSKLSFADFINIRLTEKFIKLSVSGSPDIINLGIVPCDKDSSEIEIIENFIPEKFSNEEDSITLTDEIIQALSTASSMFSTVGRNNAIALLPECVAYADRSIVLKAKLSEKLQLKSSPILLHKYTAGVLPLLYKANPTIQFKDQYETLLWKDDMGTFLVLSSEACEISLPTEEEIKSISPGDDCGVLTIPNTNLQECLNFFNGFYEASVWKPITFRIAGNKEASLYYKHPTTEITKSLASPGDLDGEFIVGSETLMKLINNAVSLKRDEDVTFYYDDNAPGVFCDISSLYEVVFAKLVE